MKSLEGVDVILASEAVWRSNILNQLGILHRCLAHRYEEPRFAGGSLVEFVRRTALEKAISLVDSYPDAMVLSADQLISLDDEVFYKSGSREKAVEQLMRLNGRTHDLICAVVVIFSGKRLIKHERAKLTMRELSRAEIENYVDRDQPWDCAGSYKIEQLGASLFQSVSVRDPTTIIGLPANLLLDSLRELGYSNLSA